MMAASFVALVEVCRSDSSMPFTLHSGVYSTNLSHHSTNLSHLLSSRRVHSWLHRGMRVQPHYLLPFWVAALAGRYIICSFLFFLFFPICNVKALQALDVLRRVQFGFFLFFFWFEGSWDISVRDIRNWNRTIGRRVRTPYLCFWNVRLQLMHSLNSFITFLILS